MAGERRVGTPEGDAPVAVGSRAVVTRRAGRREWPTTAEVAELKPPRSWGIRSLDRPVRGIEKELDVSGPSPRNYAAAAYDSARHVVVLFGGQGEPSGSRGLQDTWTWDGKRWLQQIPAHMPNPRFLASMAFDESRGVIVMFGGFAASETGPPKEYDATWTWDGTDWTLPNPATSPGSRTVAGMAYDTAGGVDRPLRWDPAR